MTKLTPQKIQRQLGQRWESYIRKECAALKKAGLAQVDKNWEAPRIPGKAGKYTRIEKSKPDFSGWAREGRHVVFEAKATQVTTRFDLSLLADHQHRAIVDAGEAGAIAFVYLLSGYGDEAGKWVLPWWLFVDVDGSSIPLDHPVYLKRGGETWLDAWERIEEMHKEGV